MKVTVVPNRNAIMLTIAYGIAAANGDDAVATAKVAAREPQTRKETTLRWAISYKTKHA